ncbi:bacteriohemerythrin [Geomonas limicola]|uniref:Bacteriohemerythrin n=1 Tax=Geomonas limicola TaxID=2740186 RepID=A0A6V8N4A7_9BACT|nr:hemerythrin domain-containing protein [Geomonas limicola]GFO67372.1 bacteriohemerythrin [Geomonas limicola]
MQHVEWKEEYLLAMSQLDNQHRRLVELLQEAYRLNEEDAAAPESNLSLLELIDFAAFHLGYEASWLDRNGYEVPAAQRRGAEHLKRQILRIQNHYFKGGQDRTEKILSFMTRWLANHLKG